MAAVTLPTHYRNVFAELGYAQAEIDARIENTFHTIFYGDEAHRFYHPTGPGLAYIEDTGNHDVRTEGMSYGMMLCVQTDHKAEFDALWGWVMHYMYMQDGPNAGFACAVSGTRPCGMAHAAITTTACTSLPCWPSAADTAFGRCKAF